MVELVLESTYRIRTATDATYRPRVYGQERSDGTWEGWIEFEAIGGGTTLRTGRETTQANSAALAYWASGLEPVYYEGALARARAQH